MVILFRFVCDVLLLCILSNCLLHFFFCLRFLSFFMALFPFQRTNSTNWWTVGSRVRPNHSKTTFPLFRTPLSLFTPSFLFCLAYIYIYILCVCVYIYMPTPTLISEIPVELLQMEWFTGLSWLILHFNSALLNDCSKTSNVDSSVHLALESTSSDDIWLLGNQFWIDT